MSDEAKKVSETKGPYTYSMYVGDAKAMNAAYAEGFKAGRASRDGLARALNDILEGGNETSAWAFGVAKRALEADGEGE